MAVISKIAGGDIKRVEVWQLSQKPASEEVTKKLKLEITRGLKPIENWRCHLSQQKSFWNVYRKEIDANYYLLDGKVYALVVQDRSIKVFPMEKAYMYIEEDNKGNLIGTSGDFYSGQEYRTSLGKYRECFLESQEYMNILLTRGLLDDPNGDLQQSANIGKQFKEIDGALEDKEI